MTKDFCKRQRISLTGWKFTNSLRIHHIPLSNTLLPSSHVNGTSTSSPTAEVSNTTDTSHTHTKRRMTDVSKRMSAVVGIFWDYDRVSIPTRCPTSTAMEWIRNEAARYGRTVEKRVYYCSRQPSEPPTPRSDLASSGFTLVDCPRRNGKATTYQKLIVDVLCFAWERAYLGAEATVVLVTSDVDYSYALTRLRDMGVSTVAIFRRCDGEAAEVLTDSANVVISWPLDTLFARAPPVGKDDKCSPSVMHAADTSPSVLTKELALFCGSVSEAQSMNAEEGTSPYSGWATEAQAAATYYAKMGEKDRDGYVNLRLKATQEGYIEWGRRNLEARGNPIIKVGDPRAQTKGLSPHTYVRLTVLGREILNPTLQFPAMMMMHKVNDNEIE
jgi:hypothetical protein